MRKQQGSRKSTLVAGLLAAGLAAMVALGGCSSEPEAEQAISDPVSGVWELAEWGFITTFDDGTWTVRGGDEEDATFDGGTYTVDSDRLTMTTVYGGAFEVGDGTCADGAVGVYDVSLADDGSSMEMVLVSDECEARRAHAGTHTKAE